MKKLSLLLGIFSVIAFANEAAHTDIIPRTINFLIFVAILWYLAGNKIINFFKQRKENIAKQFQEIEEKLKESKAKKEALKAELENAKIKAKEIIETAKKEAEILENKIKAQTEEEIKILQKQFEEFKKYETQKAKKEVVEAFLSETLKDIHITSEDAAKLILKVA